ncbi:hypothetical protein PYW07_010566 [Mythimna separata]|uniref:ATP-dependent RNA helicase DHX30 n=1 Tax=Mythimna separata TaxID=271217 RepID=A0AAD7YA59_MYTSE|nr:hypothetical protein PYW07_010566 [Mythimna separata]
MFLCKNFLARTNVCKRLLVNNAASNICLLHAEYSVLAACAQNKYFLNHGNSKYSCNVTNYFLSPLHRKWCSKGLIDDVADLTVHHGKVQKNITELFPLPRVTLNELTAKTPSKIFEIHYKQNSVAPKGRKKSTANNDWTCTYAFVWPEKAKFESTAISKRKAAEKAATQAIHWLYINNKIDAKGHPVYEKTVLQDIKNNLKEPINASISEKSVERIQKIWSDYESGIKDIYEATFKEARQRILQTPAVLTKDSTIDDDDDFSEDDDELTGFSETSELKHHVHPVYGRTVKPPSQNVLNKRNRVLEQKFEQYDEELTPLPIDDYREQITSTIDQNRVTVIVGAAGCGKSTRAPAAILRQHGANASVIVSEPRRVAAMGLAERVASELGEEHGANALVIVSEPRRVAAMGLAERVASELREEVGESVGYHIRLHSKPPKPPGGSILYCTSGVLLRRLQTNPGLEGCTHVIIDEAHERLEGCTHVIIDEAHERDVNTDVTLLLLKRASDLNPELKVVVMSATLDTGVFTSYFDPCPVIEVPGRTFPVEISYLEDIQKNFRLNLSYTAENCNKIDSKPIIKCQEVAEVIKAIDKTQKEGAILVFLPGWSDIKLTKQLLDEHYGQSSMHMILPVHSRLSTSDQVKMFSTPSRGVRKIVLATNVAETSITIPDVVYVIDSGAHKENRIKDGTGTASLETVWVSQASAKQRTGRAGRVQPGHCYRLYTREKEAEFAPHTTPEILRIPLVQTVLDCKSYAPNEKIASFLSQLPEPPSQKSINFAVNDLIDLASFLSQLPEPPSHKSINFAVNDLIDLGALTPQEQLTRLGSLLSSLTLHPRLGRSLLHSAAVGNVVAVANIVAHCASNIELFVNAADRRDVSYHRCRCPCLGRSLLHVATVGNVVAVANLVAHCASNIELFVNAADRKDALQHTSSISVVSSLTLHPRLGRSLLHAAAVGNVVAVANIVAHCASNIELFVNATDRRDGRSLLHSAAAGNVVTVANIVAHCASNIELFVNAADRRDEIREIKNNYSPSSDYSALYWIQNEFERLNQEGGRGASDRFCEKNGLRGDRLAFITSLSELHLEQLLACGVVAPATEADELRRFSDIDELASAVLLSGADVLLTTRKTVKTKGKLKTAVDVVTSTGDRAHIGTESVNKDIQKRNPGPSLLCYFGGLHSTERRALVVYKTSVVPPHTPLLFSIGDVTKEEDGDSTILTLPKHRLQINVPTNQADSILKAREMLWKTFEYYIERDVNTLDYEDNDKVSRFKVRLIKAIGRILVEGHREYVEGKSRNIDVEELR